MERLKKVVAWRTVSIVTTLAFAFAWTKDVKLASEFTLFLQAFLMVNHWLFEAYWDMRNQSDEGK